MQAYVIPFQSLGIADIGQVGGKNASLGEMISQLSHLGVRVPGGFATTRRLSSSCRMESSPASGTRADARASGMSRRRRSPSRSRIEALGGFSFKRRAPSPMRERMRDLERSGKAEARTLSTRSPTSLGPAE